MPDNVPTCLADLTYGFPVSQGAMAAALGMDERVLKRHVAEGELVYVRIGKRRKYLREDAERFLEQQRRREVAPCPSTSPRNPRTTNSTSGLTVIDFTDRRKSARSAERKR